MEFKKRRRGKSVKIITEDVIIKTRRRGKSVKMIITEDLITEIISRVPAKNLMRFNCVSKVWRSLICTDPYFNRLQIERVHQPFLLIEQQLDLSCYHYLIDLELIEDESINLRQLHHPLPDRGAFVLASCQGLLLLEHFNYHRKMALFNPVTRKHRMVPPNPASDSIVKFCGFGHDRVHDCYKLVTRISHNTFDLTFDLMIYDINNDMWYQHIPKDRRRYPGLRCCSGMGCVDGTQYWFLCKGNGREREMKKIVCFVLEVEEFYEVETPDFGEVKYYPNMVVLDGRLGLVIEGLNVERHEIWMIDMKCDSNKAYSWQWTKFLSLSNPRLPPPYDVREIPFMLPICFSACKTRILYDVKRVGFFWYDLKNHQFLKLNDAIIDNAYSRVRRFVPSLVGTGIF